MKVAEIMSTVKIGRCNVFSAELEQVGAEIAGLCSVRARNIDLKLFSYEEVLQLDPNVARWTLVAQNEALSSHTNILEDGPELCKMPQTHTDE
jgi:hypothetical protein